MTENDSTLQPEPTVPPPVRGRFIAGTTILVLLCIGAYAVLETFIVPIAWAGVLCFTTWPIYRIVLDRVGQRETLAASVMTSLVLVAVALPVLLFSWRLVDEAQQVLSMRDQLQQLPTDWIQSLPVVGSGLHESLVSWRQDPERFEHLLSQYTEPIREFLFSLAGRLGRNIVKIAMTLMSAFFFYRHGEEIVTQARAVAQRFTGERAHHRFQVVGQTLQAVVYGLLLTAMAQGLLAGLGYAVAGLSAPLLLGAGTGLLALIPFGAPIVWLPASIWVITTHSTLVGILLLAWSALVVSSIDNVVRPYIISGATKIPYLLVFFGVVGGISAFGLIGIFVGPTILAVLLALWRDWVDEERPDASLDEAE